MKAKLCLLVILCLLGTASQAQILNKIKKAAQRGVERTVEKRVEKETSKKTDKALDEVFKEDNRKGEEDSSKEKKINSPGGTSGDATQSGGHASGIVTGSSFFPNGKVIYAEDFSKDAKGDFPAGWETNSGGEIITIGGEKAFRLYPNGRYIPSVINALPENYALEFDLTTDNLDYKALAGSGFYLLLSNEKTLNKPATGGEFGFSLWKGAQDQSNRFLVSNWGKGVNKIENTIPFKMKEKLNTTTHFTIVVNGSRMRVFVDNEKAIDLPSFLQNNMGCYFQFYLRGTKAEENHIVAISGIKITEESQDLRSQILKGNFSTSNILFASGSDNIQSVSFKLLDEIAEVVKNDYSDYLIVGHTDSDGNDEDNLVLSRKRAESVKKYLVGKEVPSDRLQTDGKGESQPVASNNTPDGKAQNRRVEFLRLREDAQ